MAIAAGATHKENISFLSSARTPCAHSATLSSIFLPLFFIYFLSCLSFEWALVSRFLMNTLTDIFLIFSALLWPIDSSTLIFLVSSKTSCLFNRSCRRFFAFMAFRSYTVDVRFFLLWVLAHADLKYERRNWQEKKKEKRERYARKHFN